MHMPANNQSLMSLLVGSSSNSSKKCVVIGSGGILNQHRLGPEIDTFYDVVIRINAAPVEGFEDRVGSKTHVRILSRKNFLLVPEPRTEFFKDSLMVFVLMVPSRDEPWLQKEILDKNGMLSRLKENVRIMNPKIVMEAWKWLKYDFKPSTGLMAINYALHTCGLVDIAGFSYQCHHSAQLHYYETSTRTWDWTGWGTILSFHSYEAEGHLVKSMVKAGIIGDITGATRGLIDLMRTSTRESIALEGFDDTIFVRQVGQTPLSARVTPET
ncbi:unnamed protein product [Notodromas monacha]|uniref:Uncharacterized protein n=1 Tax=Notodromas monacha TaxID=399045 RepID=A0A7R9BU07_9CRUS|nr:unnamed protein product [Notodromas monacha]CAG0921729.1 unnamed protein product [Notodromas monacha]